MACFAPAEQIDRPRACFLFGSRCNHDNLSGAIDASGCLLQSAYQFVHREGLAVIPERNTGSDVGLSAAWRLIHSFRTCLSKARSASSKKMARSAFPGQGVCAIRSRNVAGAPT